MYSLHRITVNKKGKITITGIAESQKCKDFSIALKPMKTNKIDGWIVYHNDEIMAYQLPKSNHFSTLEEMAIAFEGQLLEMV